MLLLSLDTSSASGSTAVLRDDRVIGLLSTFTGEDYSSRMFRHVEYLLAELSLDLGRFDAFAVSSGPGSFTGLRVGLAAVKGWAEVYNRPILSVGTLEAIATQSRSAAGLLVPAFDARRGEVYFAFYRRGPAGTPVPVPGPDGESSVSSPDEFLQRVTAIADKEELCVVTPTPEVLATPLVALNAARQSPPLCMESVTHVLAPLIGQIGYRRALAGQTNTPLTLDANYVRRTDAELKWKAPLEQHSAAASSVAKLSPEKV